MIYPVLIFIGKGNITKIASACAVGAIYLVEADEGLDEDTIDYLSRQITGGSMGTFNDDPATTKEDVLSAFQKAIETA